MMHAVEKIIAVHAGKEQVQKGEIVNCAIDLAEVNDLYLQVIKSFYETGGKQVRHPGKVAFVMDHYAPAPTILSASNQKEMREFVRQQGIKHLFDIHAGICHQVMPEAGLVYPGMILVATDSHTTTHGAFGVFATGVGATDLAAILLTGELWFRVPSFIKIEIAGIPPGGVFPKDVILHILGELKQDIAIYKGVEYSGPYIDNLSVAGRMTLCNMAVEMGAKTAYIQPDDTTEAFVKKYSETEYTIYHTGAGYEYDAVYAFDVSGLKPTVAVPHSIDHTAEIGTVAGVKIDQVFIGTCTNGRLEDIKVVADILDGKVIAGTCRLVIIPASSKVYLEAVQKGYIETLIKAGATITAPGCGPCLGAHQGVVADDETVITTGSRNFPGRMGSRKAKIYAASPAVAAASALTGVLTDPSEFIK